jgi:transposase InsO family protein
MAAATSAVTGQDYGVARVSAAWDVARSSFYDWKKRQGDGTPVVAKPARRGPVPTISDEALLAAIKADLARTPWVGEGHRKVWARLRVLDGIHVSRKRVLRVMGEHRLLSPHRHPPRPANDHDGKIITEAPNVMWGTDATQIATVEHGKVWLFAVIEHWNAEAVGWHVAKIGDRYAATQAVAMAVKAVFGETDAGIARGVLLRHDHGSQFMADHFQNQVKFWGLAPSFAFVAEPETNGVAERFFRTFKDQIVHGRIYSTIDQVRDAVRTFFDRYNAEWLIIKNGLRSPNHARRMWNEADMKQAA